MKIYSLSSERTMHTNTLQFKNFWGRGPGKSPFCKKGFPRMLSFPFPPRSLQILPMYAAVYVGTADKSVLRKRIEDFVYLTQILRISGVGLLWGIRRGQHSGGAAAAVVDQRVVRAKYADLPD